MLVLDTILSPIKDPLSDVEDLILSHLETGVPLLTEVSQYILKSGGKRVRPALLLLSAGAVGEIVELSKLAASVIEYIHTATLLHDDVVDNAEIRRAKKSARSIWGNEISVLVGDYLLSISFKYLAEFNKPLLINALSEATTLMARGEILQISRDNKTATEEDYFEIIHCKTASLMGASARLGSITAGGTADQVKALHRCGTKIGMAFQMVDDALDYDAENVEFGKPFGTDLKERKITLPLSHLIKSASRDDLKTVEGILESKIITDDHVNTVCELIKKYDSIAYTLTQSKKFIVEANDSLSYIPDSPYKTGIEQLSEFIVTRKR